MAFFEADADSTAKKATQDSLGNVISSTYVKDLSASGSTVTVTRGDDTTFTFETQGGSSNLATPKTDGLMSATDKAKLDAIEEGANNTTVDEELSATSTNPLQNRAINTALNLKANTDHNHDSKYLSLDGGTVNGDITATSFTGDLNGSATKLANARTVQVNLTSTSYSTFDGTNNITPGVVGILPMANGGLGTNKADVARKNLEIAPTYAEFEPSTSTYNGLIWIGDGADADSVTYEKATVDSALSLTSENPVQNKVVTEAVTSLQNSLPFKLAISEDGVYGYIKDGADTVTPFLSATNDILIGEYLESRGTSGNYVSFGFDKYTFENLSDLNNVVSYITKDNFYLVHNYKIEDGTGWGNGTSWSLSNLSSTYSGSITSCNIQLYNYYYHGYVTKVCVNREQKYLMCYWQRPRVLSYINFINGSSSTRYAIRTYYPRASLYFFKNKINYVDGTAPTVLDVVDCCDMDVSIAVSIPISSDTPTPSTPSFSLALTYEDMTVTRTKSSFIMDGNDGSATYTYTYKGIYGTSFTLNASSFYLSGYTCNFQVHFYPTTKKTSVYTASSTITSSTAVSFTSDDLGCSLNPPTSCLMEISATYTKST